MYKETPHTVRNPMRHMAILETVSRTLGWGNVIHINDGHNTIVHTVV